MMKFSVLEKWVARKASYVKMVAGWTSRKFVFFQKKKPVPGEGKIGIRIRRHAWIAQVQNIHQEFQVPNVAFVGHLMFGCFRWFLLGFRRIPLHGPYPYWVINIMANLGVPPTHPNATNATPLEIGPRKKRGPLVRDYSPSSSWWFQPN